MIPIEINENGEIYATLQGQPVRVYAKAEPGRYAFMIRAPDRETFLAAAVQVGLLVHQNPGQDAVFDGEGNLVTPAVEPSGELTIRSGTVITELGVISESDNRYHVNFWIDQEAWEKQDWIDFALGWALNGQPGSPNKSEQSVSFQQIELIDPLTIGTPSNILL